MACINQLFIFLVLAVSYLQEIDSHGMLMEPVNRGSAWRVGFETPINYDDDANYCGGLVVQINNGGKCGLCGDNYKIPPPRPNENNGDYGTGTIVKTYKAGQKIDLVVTVTVNHMGYFRYSICPLKQAKAAETEECFAKYPLTMVDGSDRYILKSKKKGDYKMTAYLPEGLTCKQCVLRWEYVAGDNWGKCEDGKSREGCGTQEIFKSCSDITIEA